MAKLKATPKNFEQALEAFDNFKRGSRIGSVRIGNNTYLESYVDGSKVDRICVRLHDTNIVTFCEDGRILLNTGGYHTVTTKERINQFITGRIYSKNFQWWYNPPLCEGAEDYARITPRLFTEGLNVGSEVDIVR